MRQRGHDRRLGGDVDEIAAAGGVAMKQRNECADRGLGAGPAVGLRLAHPHGHAVRLACERHGAARGHELDVARLPFAARTDAAERPDSDDNQARIILPQRLRIEMRGGIGWREQADVGRAQQVLDPRPVGGRLQIEFEDSLVDVEGTPVRAAAVAAGRLELDDVRAQVGKHAAGDPAEPVRRVDDQDVGQQHGATLSTRHARA